MASIKAASVDGERLLIGSEVVALLTAASVIAAELQTEEAEEA